MGLMVILKVSRFCIQIEIILSQFKSKFYVNR